MADFLVLLVRINLAMSAAILAVALLRRPMRALFHAPLAYALWLLVPAAMLASQLPPRTVAATNPAIAYPISLPIPLVISHALPIRLAAQGAPFDWTLLLFAIWLVGAGTLLLIMALQQRQFHKAERLGAAGPAVTGFLRPRIVIPSNFEAQFNPTEQAAILAHEKAHLMRQDARINALVALLRCLCWFNPLVHVGALWLRKDQELACDAAAIKRVSRVDYANALLKSQMRVMALPLGCSWPGAEHPLTERVALLKRPSPAPARQWTGVALVLSLAAFASVGAWAAQPAETGSGAPTGKHNFTGLLFYAENDGSGQPLFLSLESVQKDSIGKHWPLGHEVMHFPYGVAWADSAALPHDFSTCDGTGAITLSGNVTLVTGSSGPKGLKGEKLVFDVRTGILDFDGKSMPSGMRKYVPFTKDCKFQ